MSRETNRGNQGIDLKTLRVQQILDGESEDTQQIRSLKAQLEAAKTSLGASKRALAQKDETIERLQAELRSRGSSSMPGDPDGYYSALGLHPNFAQELTPEQEKTVVISAYRIYSRFFAVDLGGNLERQKRINVAHEYFLPKTKTR